MRRILSSMIVVLLLALGLYAQTPTDAAELTNLLKAFLAGASRNDAAVHDRFWAEDLIYTGSSGRRIGKADILRDVRSAPPRKPADPTTAYSAEDIRIQQYGDTAVVAFRLVGTTQTNGKTRVAQYLNTGTFHKRKGIWQAVSWQATKIPSTEAESRKEVSAAEAALHQAILASDMKRLESLIDESFIWTLDTGEQMTRQQLLEQLGSRQLKYSNFGTHNVKVWVYGDTAVVWGVSSRQGSSVPGARGSSEARAFNVVYTLTLINKGGEWKAVAMHSSRP
jgi:hypothetical protein